MAVRDEMENEQAMEEIKKLSGIEEMNKQNIPYPEKEPTTIPVGTIELGPDGFVKKTEMPDAGSVVGILARSLREHGYIRIIPTERGVSVEWSSVRPVTTLSHYLQALGVDVSSIEGNGEDFSASSERGTLDIPDKWEPSAEDTYEVDSPSA